MQVKKIWITPDAEKEILYIARVSNPENQDSSNTKLIKYLIENKHWSPFEMTNLCLEINTSRAISAQILRHRSFSFQEFSQRFQDVTKLQTDIEYFPARRQDVKNRQNSIDDLDVTTRTWWENQQRQHYNVSLKVYKDALDKGIAKEVARAILPMQTQTRLYVNGTIRSWIHYLQLRTDKSTQLEHRLVALEAQKIFIGELPIVSEALGWIKTDGFELTK